MRNQYLKEVSDIVNFMMGKSDDISEEIGDPINDDDDAEKRLQVALKDIKDVLKKIPHLKDRKYIARILGQVQVDMDDLMNYFSKKKRFKG